MAKGGARLGAGRPKGSTNKPRILDYWTAKDVAEYFEHLKATYKKSDLLSKFVGEQLMGKAVQAISGPEGGPIEIKGVEIVVRK